MTEILSICSSEHKVAWDILYSLKCDRIDTATLPLMRSIKVNGNTLRGSNSIVFASFCTWGQLLKARICSSRSKFLPLKVDPISKSFHTQRSKQTFMQVITLFWDNKPRGYKTFFMLNSIEHESFPAHKCSNANNCWHFNIYEQEK